MMVSRPTVGTEVVEAVAELRVSAMPSPSVSTRVSEGGAGGTGTVKVREYLSLGVPQVPEAILSVKTSHFPGASIAK